MKEKESLQKLKEGEYSKIIFKKIPPRKCGTVVEGFVEYRPRDWTCENEADYHLAGGLTESKLFRRLYCLCKKCLEEKKKREENG